ncbi:MAG: dihydroorotase [Butyribacter sp.]|uniref:dihydroorotase n=1 Tax=Butyribacter TaxID=2822463 RepID=UPI00383EFCE4|nr:dihydroorotase [Roseburia hominis]
MEKILIKNGRVVDPANYIDGKKDILIEDGKIKKVADFIVEDEDTNVIDADEKAVMPGFIDLHVHLREPGFEYKETIETGSKAAARGGVTSICPMPNTKPVIDSPESVKDLLKRADCSPVHILPIGACTIGQEGKELADIEGMKDAGIVALSEDGKSVMDSALFRKLLKEAARLDLPMFSHCEDKALVEGGVMNKGKKSEELGLPGITNSVEDVIVARDIIMSKEAGNRLHLCHCSTADSVVLVEMAKKQGLPVSAEVCPHHFTMSDDEITEDNGRFKMNPPLRNRADVDALKEGLKTGIMEVISTDHAPHGKEEKDQSMLKAPFGIVGLETSFALGYTELVDKGVLTLSQLVEKMSVNPAKVLGIDKGNLAPGKAADIVIADITKEYKIDSSKFVSKGKNTPFDGKKVKGRVITTIVDGKIVYKY